MDRKTNQNELNEMENYYLHSEPEVIIEGVLPHTSIKDAWKVMRQYRDWTTVTLQIQQVAIKQFTTFCNQTGIQPVLSAPTLPTVKAWVREQQEKGLRHTTIRQRVSVLSGLFRFFKELGVIESNPFGVIRLPKDEVIYSPRILTLAEIEQVFQEIDRLKQEGVNLELPVRSMLFTGLRNHDLAKIQVKDVNWEEGLLHYGTHLLRDQGPIPLPDQLLSLLWAQVESRQLQPEDPLLYGISGQPIQSKQLNRITSKICHQLNWTDEKRFRPNDLRNSMTQLLMDRQVREDLICWQRGIRYKSLTFLFSLRHDERLNKGKVELQEALNQVEQELEQAICTKQNH